MRIGRLTGVVLGVLTATAVHAQYLEQKEYGMTEARYISGGVMWRNFAPTGSNTAPDSLKIRFTNLSPALSFHQGLVDVLFSFGSYSLAGRSMSTLFFSTTVGNDFMLSGRPSSALIAPLHIAAEYMKAESPGVERDHFNVASLGLGGGLKYHLQTRDVEFSLELTETAEYCLSGWNSESGFSALTAGDVALLLRGINVFNGIAIGYRFRYQTWSMSDTRHNARSIDHGPYLGIMF